jgi:hypothetical protein
MSCGIFKSNTDSQRGCISGYADCLRQLNGVAFLMPHEHAAFLRQVL